MRQVYVPAAGVAVAAVGQGTWRMGEAPERHREEVEALRLGIALGMTLIDTAEYYGAGGAERVVGDAIADQRERVFVVTKVWPSHAGEEAAIRAVRASLRRLRTDYVDAVLLHWPTRSVPLEETLRAFARLEREGLVRFSGVSNFTPAWLARLDAAWGRMAERPRLALHQVPYSVGDRRVESRVLPDAERRGWGVMAYSPLGQGRLERVRGYDALVRVARGRGVSPYQVALNWLLRRPGVVVIPKATNLAHVRDNAAAGTWTLEPEEVGVLEDALGPPRGDLATGLPPWGPFFALAYWFETRRTGRRGDGRPATAS
ncbi:MAG: aldo/keto reductase [Actinomycetia bacterium]|nr:aldo/keto reductase [Actinomycetes bacterium]